jgi:hypothetical protein
MDFQNKLTSRLIAPWIDAQHLHGDALGRALETLYTYGVTELYSYGTVNLQRFGWLGPSAIERDQRQETHQHQDADHQQDGGHVPAQHAHVQASCQQRAQLSA